MFIIYTFSGISFLILLSLGYIWYLYSEKIDRIYKKFTSWISGGFIK